MFQDVTMKQGMPQILFAEEVFDWLDSSQNQAAWETLYRRCPWRFPTLGPEYFRLWFRHYSADWQPLLVVVAPAAGELRLIMPLAVREGLITGVGAHQAEYQGWLCREAEQHELLRTALLALDARLPAHRLRLHYLAPGISEAIVRLVCQGHSRAMSTVHSRPLMRLDPDLVDRALRKKGTRSKINRLKRRGQLTFRRFTELPDIERHLDAVIEMYDFRQGAANDSCPFVDDPHKKGFLLDWAKQAASGELHISCLMLDDEVIGAYVGLASGDTSQLAILAHAPRYSALSPGKIQVYETARLLLEEGLSCLDLTPGGDPWKERFANAHDQVFSLTVHASRRAARAVWLRKHLDSLAHRLLSKTRFSPRDIKRFLNSIRRPLQPPLANARKSGRGNLYDYQLTRHPSDGPSGNGVHRNLLHDLTLYRATDERLSRQAFLQQALSRIESGEDVYTLLQEGHLAACAWVRPEQTDRAVIHDIRCIIDDISLPGRLTRGLLAHLKESDVTAVRLRVDANEGPGDDWIGDLGFTPVTDPVIDAADDHRAKEKAK